MSVHIQEEDDEMTLLAVQTLESLHRNYDQRLNAYEIVGISVYRELNRRRSLAALENDITIEILMDMITQRLIAGTRRILNEYHLPLHDDIRDELTGIMFDTQPPPPPKPPLKPCVAKSDCSICLNAIGPGDTIYDLPCNHTFHEACLSQWLDRQHSCPLCRQKI